MTTTDLEGACASAATVGWAKHCHWRGEMGMHRCERGSRVGLIRDRRPRENAIEVRVCLWKLHMRTNAVGFGLSLSWLNYIGGSYTRMALKIVFLEVDFFFLDFLKRPSP